MATFYTCITAEQADLLRSARVFFVATAEPGLAEGPEGTGPVNLSPRGGVPLHILSPNRVAFLDHEGSGNETARHSLAGGPITLMVCSFDAENAAIVRLYGQARVTPVADSSLREHLLQQVADNLQAPLRQIIEIDVQRTMTSCGYGVPVMTFVRERGLADRGRRYKGGSDLAETS